MSRRLPQWCELLDSAGWCVALAQPGLTVSIWPHAKAVFKGRGVEPGTWTELLAALATVIPSDRPLQGEYLQVWKEQDPATIPDTGEAVCITTREQEILHWLREGKSSLEIAIIVGCAGRTVEKHISNLYRKLGVNTRSMAILRLKVVSESLLPAPERNAGSSRQSRKMPDAQEESLYEADARKMERFVKVRLNCCKDASIEKLEPLLLMELMKGQPISMIAKSLAIRSDSVQRRLRTVRDELGVDHNRQLSCMLNLLRAD